MLRPYGGAFRGFLSYREGQARVGIRCQGLWQVAVCEFKEEARP